MQLILAIDGDRRQAEQLASLVRGRLGAELVQATSAGEALQAIGERVPDLIMTSPLLSPFDDGVLAEYLRDLGPAAAHVQTLRIPVLGAPTKKSVRGLFSLRRKRPAESAPDGCDPNVLADEIAVYLARAAEERQAASAAALIERVRPEQDVAPAAVDSPVYVRDAVEHVEPEQAVWTSLVEHTEAEPVVHADVSRFDAELTPSVDESLFTTSSTVDSDPPPPEVTPLVVESAEPTPRAFEEIAHVDETTPPAVAHPVLAMGAEPVGESEVEPLILETQDAEPSVLLLEADSPAVDDIPPANVPHVADVPPQDLPRTSSFEAALAAIRAAWGNQPRSAAPAPLPRDASLAASDDLHPAIAPAPLAPEAAKAPEIDLTCDVDALKSASHVTADEPKARAAVSATVPDDDVYELSASPALHDLDAALAAAAPPPAAPSPVASLAPARADLANERVQRAPERRRTDKARKRTDKSLHTRTRSRVPRPVQDEWGVFDPDQCGFSALVDKLDEVTETGDARVAERSTVRVISFS